jgi:hypothetical protein
MTMIRIIMLFFLFCNSAHSFPTYLQGILTCKAAYRTTYSGIDVYGCYTGDWDKTILSLNDYFLYNKPENVMVAVFYDEKTTRFFFYYR